MSSSNFPSAIFWDMDGTLVDSEPLWGQATFEMSEAMGRRLTPDLRDSTVGGSIRGTIDIVAGHVGVPPDYTYWRRWMYDRMAVLMQGNLVPNPGVRELLGSLDAPMLVCTNTERELADPSIDAVGRHFFIDSVAGDEVETPKPAPDMYLEAACRVGSHPSDCLIFEDSWNGMTGAVASGCTVIGLVDDVPAGVVPLSRLRGENNFEGATADELSRWWTTLNDREEL